ncbi:hypothetical protein BH23ACT6_BH23ACT6_19580 [soil metagenome]
MRKISLALALAAAGSLGMAGAATAAHDDNPSAKVASNSYGLPPVQAESVPNSQATGSTRIKALPNGKVQVKVKASGLAPNLPHAMHLHGVPGDAKDLGCPGPAADTDGNGFVTTLEGVPFYGGIVASLTTSGDTTPSSALALDRFAVADENGNLSYSRTFRSAAAFADAGTVQVVVHGIDFNGNGAYDFDAGPSSLTDAFPLEGTIPVLCGGIAN